MGALRIQDITMRLGQEVPRGSDWLVPQESKANTKTKEKRFYKENFTYDVEKDVYVCPCGRELPFFENTSEHGKKYRKYRCIECLKREQSTTPSTGRYIRR